MLHSDSDPSAAPGGQLDLAKMPGHWLLARMGKHVLRPGGLELTRTMLDHLEIGPDDDVVELAPGLGTTTCLALAQRPRSYVGVERNSAAAESVRRLLNASDQRCVTGTAADTGLDTGRASVVYGEAMLTMQTPGQKRAIVQEALRLLRPGGRYGIHELSVEPDDLDEPSKSRIQSDLSRSIRVGARPLTLTEWTELLESAGFEVEAHARAPMLLLEPIRLLQDEGIAGALRIAFNVARTPVARRRVLQMRRTFRLHADALGAIMLVARKPT